MLNCSSIVMAVSPFCGCKNPPPGIPEGGRRSRGTTSVCLPVARRASSGTKLALDALAL
jgi:hypothetical protein